MTDQHFYFDTSIWIDVYDERGSNGEVAKKLVERIIINDDLILYSYMVIVELKKLGYSEFEINEMMNVAKPDHLRHIHLTKEQTEEARKVSKQRNVPFGDVLHAILARDHEAQLVTRDWDFERLRDITKTVKPEELIQRNAE